MKILLVDEFKTVNYSGGIERVLCNFANEFIKRGYEITLCCMDKEKGMPLFHLEDKVNFINMMYTGSKYNGIYYLLTKIQKELFRAVGGSEMTFMGKKLPDTKKSYFRKQFISRLRKLIIDEQPDIIINVSPDSNYYCHMACVNIYPKPKIICTIHMDPEYLFPQMDDIVREKMYSSDLVQFLMPRYAAYGEKFGLKNVVVIPNAVNSCDECADVKNSKVVVCVGRLEQILKRQHIAIEAFIKIANKFPEWSLRLYGDNDRGLYYKSLMNIIKENGMMNRISIMGISNNIYNELSKAGIFVFPSAREGFGLAMVEAMYIGLPVVGFKSANGVNDIVIDGENGLLANDGVDDFARKLAALMEDSQMRIRLAKNAKQCAQAYCSKDIWDKWEEVIFNTNKSFIG